MENELMHQKEKKSEINGVTANDNYLWRVKQPAGRFKRYVGEWVCISGKRVVYHDADAFKVFTEAEKYPGAFLSYIKKPGIYLLWAPYPMLMSSRKMVLSLPKRGCILPIKEN